MAAAAPVAAAAGPPGWLVSGLLTLGPLVLGRLFGGMDPQEKLRRQIAALLSEGSISNTTQSFLRDFYGSPQYSQLQGLAQSAGAGAELSAASGAAGAGVTSGVDLLSRAAASGVGRTTMANINANAFDQARKDAIQALMARAQGIGNVGPSPNYTANLFGSGLDAFMKYWLTKNMYSRPQTGGIYPPQNWIPPRPEPVPQGWNWG